ncbi:plasma membrane proteolipid 3, partial [Phyllosticta citrichinensis]
TQGNFCAYLIALFLPPLPVFSRRGCGADLLISIALTILGWLPGVIHACYIIHQGKKVTVTAA